MTKDIFAIESKPIIKKPSKGRKNLYILDEFEQLKTYFRKGTRPSMQKAISNFEKHLEEII